MGWLGGVVCRTSLSGCSTVVVLVEPWWLCGQVVARLRQRRLVAFLEGIEALQWRLGFEALRQGMLYAPQVVWLSDGGRGLWRLFEER